MDVLLHIVVEIQFFGVLIAKLLTNRMYLRLTSNHSSKMRTDRLSITCASVATRCEHWFGGSSSEQVRIGLQSWPQDVTTGGPLGEQSGAEGVLYGEV